MMVLSSPATGYRPSRDRRHMSRIHRYPTRTLLADYGRGAVGAGISGTFWALSPVALYSMVLFGGLTALFLLFVLRTALRHRMRIVSDADGIGVDGRAPLLWRELEDIRLRSEEHTSELQSLMRISYAVFCLTKKNLQTNTKQNVKKTK